MESFFNWIIWKCGLVRGCASCVDNMKKQSLSDSASSGEKLKKTRFLHFCEEGQKLVFTAFLDWSYVFGTKTRRKGQSSSRPVHKANAALVWLLQMFEGCALKGTAV